MKRTIFNDEHDAFRASVGEFVRREIAPFVALWEEERAVPRSLWRKAGAAGLLCPGAPKEYGGAGVRDFRFNQIIDEELAPAGASGMGIMLQNVLVLPYLLYYATAEQKRRWLPGLVSGECVGALAMTEPGAGSDLAAIRTTAARDGDGYVLDGSKIFIGNGIGSDLLVVAAKTDPEAGRKGISLLVVERGMGGFERVRKLNKMGLHAQDTAELRFHNVRVPRANLLGEENQGFTYLMSQLAQERLSVAVTATATAAHALELTSRYCRERTAFGQPIGTFQHSRFKLAEMKTEIEIARVFVDRCVTEHNAGSLSAADAAMAKWWTTELLRRVADQCVQLHGGYGYLLECPLARIYMDARATTIAGGTTEVMKEIIGRAMGF